MFNQFLSNVIWVDFKTKQICDLADLEHLEKPTQPIPWLCQKARIKERKNGYR